MTFIVGVNFPPGQLSWGEIVVVEVGCGMSATGEDNHFISPQKFFYGDDFFVYDYGDNNVVSLIQPTTDSTDIPEAYMTDEDVVPVLGLHCLRVLTRVINNRC